MSKPVYFPPGQQIGNNEIVELRHSHDLSAVYEIEDAKGEHFALKVHHHTKDLPMEERRKNVARLRREYDVLRIFQGLACFPEVYDLNFHGGDAVLLMELLQVIELPEDGRRNGRRLRGRRGDRMHTRTARIASYLSWATPNLR